MNDKESLCFRCNHPESDHPLVVLTQGITCLLPSSENGVITVSHGEVRIQLGGRSWLYQKFCNEFVGQVQLTLF